MESAEHLSCEAILDKVGKFGVIPVIVLDSEKQAIPLAKALIAGGLPAAEVTFRTKAGEGAIKLIAKECPEVLVGAGTVLNEEQCDRAIAAGAKFIVSPGYSESLVAHCQKRRIAVLPGTSNASELMKAYNAGLTAVKFFPAEQSGGIAFLKAVSSVFPTLRFMPTGGINTKNLKDYLTLPGVFACGGTWMVKKSMIDAGQFDKITALVKDAVSLIKEIRA